MKDRFFIPFAAGDLGKEGEWRQGHHGRSGVQRRIHESTRAAEFKNIVKHYHLTGRASWDLALQPGYQVPVFELLLNRRPLRLWDFAAWVLRFCSIPETEKEHGLEWVRRTILEQYRIPDEFVRVGEAEAVAAQAWFYTDPSPDAGEFLTAVQLSELELLAICEEFATPGQRAASRGSMDAGAVQSGDHRSAREVLLASGDAAASIDMPADVLASIATHLRRGSHILLMGPPGTGKSTLARNIMEAIVSEKIGGGQIRRPSGYVFTTATASWTTFDTIGGYVPDGEDRLVFKPGIFLNALASDRWIVVDEINRADADKAFGQFLTILSGLDVAIELPYVSGGAPVTIVPPNWEGPVGEPPAQFRVPSGWRMIGTLNTFDKNTLFRMSFAFLRRFAVVYVPTPPAARTHEICIRAVRGELSDHQSDRLFKLLVAAEDVHRPIGPAIALAISRYIVDRTSEALPKVVQDVTSDGGVPASADLVHEIAEEGDATRTDTKAFLEAIVAFVLPQMEGLESDLLVAFRDRMLSEGVLDRMAEGEVRQYFREVLDLVE